MDTYLKNWIEDRLAWLASHIASLEIVTDVQDEYSDARIIIFPNPINGNLDIKVENANSDDIEICLFDDLGKQIQDWHLTFSQTHNVFSITQVIGRKYLLSLVND